VQQSELVRSPFSANIPQWQVAYDSTSLGWLKTCARLYKYQMIDQWSPKSRGIHLMFGGLYASGVEHYAHYRAAGDDHDTATLKMVRWVLENSGTRSDDGVWVPWSPGDHKDANIKNRYTLIRSLVWNVEEHLTSPFQTVVLADGRPAVELTFNFDAFEIEGETVSLSGHLDRLAEANGELWVLDDKTTKGALNAQYFKGYTPHNQMSLYAIAGKVIADRPVRGVLIRAAQIGVGFTRFATGQAPRPSAVLTEWLHNTETWIRQAREYAIADYWPMNETSCDKFGGCAFRDVCAVSPSHRPQWLEEGFERREWNPLIARGDI